MNGGWWRRNRWGLLLLVPAVAAALAGPYFRDAHVYLENPTEPHVPVAGAKGGWVTYAGARMRLDAVTEVESPADRSGKPADLGGGRVWQAKVTYETADAGALAGCTVYLEDGGARRFGDRPVELSPVGLPSGGGCDRPRAAGASAPPGEGPYQRDYYFLLPAGATPAAFFVGVPTAYPSYAHLPRP
ncbi:hypothetical protein ABT369_31400 [Dactylosporangium sp. NPDC000244]|uniref:hypothetical protein n=1 Tax=Dactylosporangium sp. NPDC000244 TaxID=3154365 RepID=UPI0033296538